MQRRLFLKTLSTSSIGISYLGLSACQTTSQKTPATTEKTSLDISPYFQLSRGRGTGYLIIDPETKQQQGSLKSKDFFSNKQPWKEAIPLRLVFDEKTLSKKKAAEELLRDSIIWQAESKPDGVQITVSKKLYDILRAFKMMDHWAYDVSIIHESKTYPYKVIVPNYQTGSATNFDFSKTGFVKRNGFGRTLTKDLKFKNAANYELAKENLESTEQFLPQGTLFLLEAFDFFSVDRFFYVSETMKKVIAAKGFKIDVFTLDQMSNAQSISFDQILVEQ